MLNESAQFGMHAGAIDDWNATIVDSASSSVATCLKSCPYIVNRTVSPVLT